MSPDIAMMASLDHAMWFHKRDFQWDDWILYSTDSPYTGGSRGLEEELSSQEMERFWPR